MQISLLGTDILCIRTTKYNLKGKFGNWVLPKECLLCTSEMCKTEFFNFLGRAYTGVCLCVCTKLLNIYLIFMQSTLCELQLNKNEDKPKQK